MNHKEIKENLQKILSEINEISKNFNQKDSEFKLLDKAFWQIRQVANSDNLD